MGRPDPRLVRSALCGGLELHARAAGQGSTHGLSQCVALLRAPPSINVHELMCFSTRPCRRSSWPRYRNTHIPCHSAWHCCVHQRAFQCLSTLPALSACCRSRHRSRKPQCTKHVVACAPWYVLTPWQRLVRRPTTPLASVIVARVTVRKLVCWSGSPAARVRRTPPYTALHSWRSVASPAVARTT